MRFNRIVVTGSLAYDHIMSMPGKFNDHIMSDKLHILNVSFIMEKFRKEYGGTGGNIAYTLSLLKTHNILLATAGHDFANYLKHLNSQKYIDTSGIKVYKSIPTASGFVMTDQNDNQIWGFYEGAMKKASILTLSKIKSDDFLVISPNDPMAMIRYAFIAIKYGIPYMFDPAFNIPHFNLTDLRKAVGSATILVGNDYEIELVRRRLRWKRSKLLDSNKLVITTLGSNGSQIYVGGKNIKINPAHPNNENDPTGAGDAYRAGFLAGYVRGYDLKTCGQMGSVASIYTVEKYGTQTHKYTLSQFKRRYKTNYKEKISID
jgi:adenosine kinase